MARSFSLVTIAPPDEHLWLVGIPRVTDVRRRELERDAEHDAHHGHHSAQRGTIRFENNSGISAKKGALGMSLQTPASSRRATSRSCAAGATGAGAGRARRAPQCAHELYGPTPVPLPQVRGAGAGEGHHRQPRSRPRARGGEGTFRLVLDAGELAADRATVLRAVESRLHARASGGEEARVRGSRYGLHRRRRGTETTNEPARTSLDRRRRRRARRNSRRRRQARRSRCARASAHGDEDATVRASAATWFEARTRPGCVSPTWCAILIARSGRHASVGPPRGVSRARAVERRRPRRRYAGSRSRSRSGGCAIGAVIALARGSKRGRDPSVARRPRRSVLARSPRGGARAPRPWWQRQHDRDPRRRKDRTALAARLRYIERRLRRGQTRPPASRSSRQPAGLVADPDPAVITARLGSRGITSRARALRWRSTGASRAATARLLARPDLRAIRAASIWLEDPRLSHMRRGCGGAPRSPRSPRRGRGACAARRGAGGTRCETGVTVWALSFIVLNRRWEWVDCAMVRAARAESPMVRRSSRGPRRGEAERHPRYDSRGARG